MVSLERVLLSNGQSLTPKAGEIIRIHRVTGVHFNGTPTTAYKRRTGATTVYSYLFHIDTTFPDNMVFGAEIARGATLGATPTAVSTPVDLPYDLNGNMKEYLYMTGDANASATLEIEHITIAAQQKVTLTTPEGSRERIGQWKTGG